MKSTVPSSLAALALGFFCAAAGAAPQSFKSGGTPGSMDDYYKITVVRDCLNLKDEPYVKCTKQEIVMRDKAGKQSGEFDAKQIPRNHDGTFKVNLSDISVVDDDTGGGNSVRYFLLRFVPQDNMDQQVYGNGQTFPNYYEVVTDTELRPLKGMKLQSGQATQIWLDKMQKKSAQLKRRGGDIEALKITEYVHVMSNN